jgi:UDP:flavonoid glycosyltransferase YjiC (YdhE family)
MLDSASLRAWPPRRSVLRPLVITPAGLQTTLTARCRGLPVLAIPITNEQVGIAAAAAAAAAHGGAGRGLPRANGVSQL